MSMRVVVLTQYFKTYYERKLDTKNRVGQLPRRKEILCAVAIKMIKVIFALLRDKRRLMITYTVMHYHRQHDSKKWLWWRRTVLLRKQKACRIQLVNFHHPFGLHKVIEHRGS